jgi:hypothetical protein
LYIVVQFIGFVHEIIEQKPGLEKMGQYGLDEIILQLDHTSISIVRKSIIIFDIFALRGRNNPVAPGFCCS